MVFMYQGQSLSGGGSGADENVKQVPTSSGSNYEVLFSGGTNNTEETNYARKTNAFRYSPDTQSIHLGFTANNGNTGISLDGLTGSIKSNLNSTDYVEIGQYGRANAIFYKYADGVYYGLAIDSSDISIIQGQLWDGDTTSLKNAIRLTAKKSNIAEEFDIFNAYAVGDYCIEDNILYICTTAVTGDGSNFNPSDWTATSVTTELKSKANKSEAISNITRSGTTFTATKADGTTFTFTQQDNNTTYTFATGDSNGQIKITPSGGTAQNVSVKGLAAAAYIGTPVSIANGGTGASTRLNAFKAITNQDVSSNATHFVTFTSNWATAGYSDVSSVKKVLNIVAGASGNWFNYRTPVISAAGVIEIGKYLDFHTANAQTNDYTFRFENTGNTTMTAYGTISQTSSRKIKENIKPIEEEEALKILELEPVSFDYKEKFGGDKDHRGFIAEDVAEILPNLTSEEQGDEKDLKHFTPMSLSYNEMIPYLVKVIQIQEKRISELESKLN